MATYGKKKKNLFAGFSGMQDDKPKRAADVYSRPSHINKIKTAMTRSMTWSRPDDLDVDHLAGETLVGRSSHERARTRSSSVNSAPIELSRFNSAMSISDTGEMPLLERPPPIPPLPSGNFNRREPVQRVLDAPVAKPKTPTKGNLRSTRPKISGPILSESGPSDHALLSKFDGAYLPDTNTPRTTSADAANLSQKISHLVQQSAAQEAQDDASPEQTPRPSPLQRGKKALVKATRALVIRISSSSSNIGRQASSSVSSSADPSADNSPTRIELRMAEAENLRRYKVQQVMGDGFVPRKPLPGSVVAKPCSPDPSIEDPFVEEQIEMVLAMDESAFTRRGAQRGSRPDASSSNISLKATESLGPPMTESSTSPNAGSGKGKQADRGISSGNAFDVATRTAGPTPTIPCDVFSGQTQKSEKLSFASVPVVSPVPRASHTSLPAFSDSISGLAQHPDVMCFTSAPNPPTESGGSTPPASLSAVTRSPSGEFLSSSPIGFSTPRVRLEPQSTPDGKKRLAAVPARYPSFFDFNLGDLIESDELDIASNRNRITNRRLSVKRKSATEDLRSHPGPAKRTKRASVLLDGSKEETQLSTENDPLGAAGRHALTAKNKNEKVFNYSNDSMRTMGDAKNGLMMFEEEEKETLVAKEETNPWMSPGLRGAGRRSMLPRPVNAIYGLAQSSRSQLPYDVDDPETEIDELQTWDQAYHVGGMKRQ